MKQYLIIGNGPAGTTAAETIRKLYSNAGISIVTKEDLPYYSRIRLPEYISGSISERELIVRNSQWYVNKNINLFINTIIEKIDFKEKKVFRNNGEFFYYDKLLLATGSHSFIPPVQGNELKNLFTLKTIQDARMIFKEMENGMKEVIIIGGGLLGLEIGAHILSKGHKVTVVEFFDRLLPRQLDNQGAKKLQQIMETMGFYFKLEQVMEKILGKTEVEGLLLKSGERLQADMIIICAGVRPNLELAIDRLKTDRAIVVNERMETSVADVYAAGDVAQFNGFNYCIWPEAMDQGKVAGTNMAGSNAIYINRPPSNKLKVAGIQLASAGKIEADDLHESEIFSDENVYKKLVKDRDGNLLGCIMLGDTSDFDHVVKQIK